MELEVEDPSMYSFLQQEREVWSSGGHPCQVEGCCTEVFPTLRKYLQHRGSYHSPYHLLSQC